MIENHFNCLIPVRTKLEQKNRLLNDAVSEINNVQVCISAISEFAGGKKIREKLIIF